MAKDREISQKDFEKLLNWLNSDRELAGIKYEAIRQRLVKVFTLRGCQIAEELADSTIDIVIEKMDSLTESYEGDPALYFYGVGKKVLSRFFKTPQLEVSSDPQFIQEDFEDENTIRKHDCLEKCLEKLTDEQRKLIIAYYQNDKREKINHRKLLASERGMTPDRLRINIHRIKNTIEKCVRQCTEDVNKRFS